MTKLISDDFAIAHAVRDTSGEKETYGAPVKLLQAIEDNIAAPPALPIILAAMTNRKDKEPNPRKKDLIDFNIGLLHKQTMRAAAESARRLRYIKKIGNDPIARAKELEKCKNGVDGLIHWVNNWAWTVDPRAQAVAVMPFLLFPFQDETLRKLYSFVFEKQTGALIEKSRDMGVTWLIMIFNLWAWNFKPRYDALLGSRKEELVDTKGEMDSHFEKLRFCIRMMPDWMLPTGFNREHHSNCYMRIINPATGSYLTGESSNVDFGRQGRYTCVTGDTLVPTSEGLLTFNEIIKIRPLYCFDPDGILKPIRGYLIRPPEPVYEITTKYGFKIKCTADHPMLTITNSGCRKYKKPSEMKIAISQQHGAGDHLAARVLGHSLISNRTDLTEELARVLGYLVSEGAVNKPGKIEFCQKEQEIFDEYVNDFESAFGVKPKTRLHDSITQKGIPSHWTAAYYHNSKIRKFLHSLGLAYVKAKGKEIPLAIRQAPLFIMRAFLQALFEGDGSVETKGTYLRVTYCSKSETLVRQVHILLLFFDIVGSVRYEKEPRDSWRLVIDSGEAVKFGEKIGFRSKKKSAKFETHRRNSKQANYVRVKNRECSLLIQSIRELPAEPTYDLELEDHMFLANGMISHNCIFPDEFAAFPNDGTAAWTACSQSSQCIFPSSTPRGKNNQFANLRFKSDMEVISLHWRLHPWRDVRWYEGQKTRMTPQMIAQELDMDYEASQPGQILPMHSELHDVITRPQFCDFYGQMARTDAGEFQIPRHWQLGMALDWGNTEEHRCAIVWVARPSEQDALRDCVFVYREYVAPIGATPREVAKMIRKLEAPGREHHRMTMRLMSHEASSQMNTFIKEHNLPFSKWNTAEGYNFGIGQLQNYLEPRAYFDNPFKPIKGRPKMYLIVAKGQGETILDRSSGKMVVMPANDADGLLRLRTELPLYHYPVSEQGKAVQLMRPFKFMDDMLDALRALAAEWFPAAGEENEDEKRERRLRPEIRAGVDITGKNALRDLANMILSRQMALSDLKEAELFDGKAEPGKHWRESLAESATEEPLEGLW